MRKRYQHGCLRRISGSWVAQWREGGRLKKKALGRLDKMTKSEARIEFDEILGAVNRNQLNGSCTLENFVTSTYMPFYKRKWKASTAATNEGRVKHHITSDFGEREIGSFTRTELQDFLDEKAMSGLSFSVVDHLRWDLRQVFELAQSEGLLRRNPALMLFTPRAAKRPLRKRLKWKEVKLLFSVLESRERLIAMLAVIAGMRPGEIFALQWKHIRMDRLSVRQRVYRGDLDTPKTQFSVRDVALPDELQGLLREWRSRLSGTNLDDWVFPSEKGTPLSRDNVWNRNFKPALKEVDLEWATFQVMRRTHSSLMKELSIDPKLVADQQGHSLDVNLNVYTKSSIRQRKKALDKLESRLAAA